MELRFSEDDRTFQTQVRTFISETLPRDIRRRVEVGATLQPLDHTRWQKLLYKRGWIAPNWPVEHGGPGWSPVQQYIFDEELTSAPTPQINPFGLMMVGPVIITFGNEEQKKYFLPRILRSEDWWCQGYSEPGAGSDLASLQTRAVVDGDDYIVNGVKTWITWAQHADWIFCLVRTSKEEKRQLGISFLLIDMCTPGIEVRPIRTYDGSNDEINEVRFNDVRVPQSNLVGAEGKGWTCAKFLLGHERTGNASVGVTKRWLAGVRHIAGHEYKKGRPLIEDRVFARRVARIEVEVLALESLVLRVLSEQTAGKVPGPFASLLKLRGTELQQEVAELAYDALGYYGFPNVAAARQVGSQDFIGPGYAAGVAIRHFNFRKASIYAGSNEIQRNIISKAVLGF